MTSCVGSSREPHWVSVQDRHNLRRARYSVELDSPCPGAKAAIPGLAACCFVALRLPRPGQAVLLCYFF